MVVPFLALYLTTTRGLTPGEASIVLGLFGVGAVISQVVGGVLVDRVGPRSVFGASLVTAAVFMFALGFARGLPMILVAAFLVGITLDMYRPAATTVMARAVPPQNLTRAYALLHWAINIGFSLSAVAGGVLARYGYIWLFVVDAAACLLFALVTWALLAPDPAGPDHRRPSVREHLTVVRDGLYAVLLLTMLARAVVQFQSLSTLPLTMLGDGLDTADYGLVLGANGVVVVVLSPVLIRLVGRWEPETLLTVGTIVLGVGFGANAVADSLSEYLAAVVVWTVGEIAIASAAFAVVARIAPPGAQGIYQGMLGMTYGVATVLAPVAGIAVLDGLGSTTLWVGNMLLCVLAALVQLGIRGHLYRRTEQSV